MQEEETLRLLVRIVQHLAGLGGNKDQSYLADYELPGEKVRGNIDAPDGSVKPAPRGRDELELRRMQIAARGGEVG